MKRIGLTLFVGGIAFCLNAQQETTTELEGITVQAPAQKEELPLQERASATTGLSMSDISEHQITDLKSMAGLVPNLHNPDYGSRTTSALYIRGIGTRMDQPAVGLYVDGIPYMNKSAFDFNLSGIHNITVARGPQGTLYGRNTMAGIIDIATELPDLLSPRTTLEAGYGAYNQAEIKASHFNHIGKVGISVNGYYDRNDGYWTNHYNGDKVGEEWNAGGRMNLTYQKNRFNSLFTISYDHTDQNGYAYAQLDSTNHSTGIDYNHDCTYVRDLLTSGLKLEYAWPKVILSSATSFQYLNDDMTLDNDFTSADIFTLQQKQDEKAFTEEVVLKTNQRDGQFRHYNFLTGVSTFRRNLDLEVPVTMEREGITNLIETNVNSVAALQRMGFTLNIQNEQLPIGTSISYPTTGAALFHQSTFNLNKAWSIEAGLRADYEKTSIDYDSDLQTRYTFPPMINEEQTVSTSLHGSESQDYWELLPKLTAKYQWEKGKHSKMVYATIARGYKSGGYNTQMMSDILQYQMQKDLKEDLYSQIPAEITVARQTMYPILMGMEEVDVKKVLEYKPEYSWNYEVGTKLNFDKISLQAAFFFIDCRDQQVTVFSNLGGMGRMMRNAGHTQSYGAELSATYQLTDWLALMGNYGYTHATFKDYQANDSTNYKGNHVPFAPEQTYMVGLAFKKDFNKLGRLFANVDFSGAANTYWTDDNTIKEEAYGTLNATIGLTPRKFNKLTVSIWGKNLTDSEYNTFYFESMGNKFVQKGKPVQGGIKATLRF